MTIFAKFVILRIVFRISQIMNNYSSSCILLTSVLQTIEFQIVCTGDFLLAMEPAKFILKNLSCSQKKLKARIRLVDRCQDILTIVSRSVCLLLPSTAYYFNNCFMSQFWCYCSLTHYFHLIPYFTKLVTRESYTTPFLIFLTCYCIVLAIHCFVKHKKTHNSKC